MELERLYTTLIDVEDCEKKIAALPTGTPLRKQVEEERVTALNTLVASLNVENKIKRYLLVRKGKVLLKRCLRVLDDTSVQLFTSSLFQLLPKALKRDREDQIVPKYLEDLKPHIQGANLELILHYFKLLNAGTAGGGNSPSPKISFATFKLTVTNGFGVSVILLLMKYLLEMWESLSSTEEKEAKKLLNELASAIADAGDSVAQPLEPVKVDIDQLVMDSKELRKLAAIGGADRS